MNMGIASILMLFAPLTMRCVLMIVFYVVWAILHLMKLMGRDT